MRVLIIGGSVFIGRALAFRLQELGATVAVLNRGTSEPELPATFQQMVGNRDDLPAAQTLIRGFEPNVVLHNIVMNKAHVRGWLQACRDLGARLIMTSSCDVYAAFGRSQGIEEGAVDNVPLTEEAPLRTTLHPYRMHAPDDAHALWHYDKIPAERLLLASHDDAAVLRLPMVYGPRDPQHRLRAWIESMDDGKPTIVHSTTLSAWRSCYGFIDNVADAMAQACLAPTLAHAIYNVADVTLSTRELMAQVARATGWDGTYETCENMALPEADRDAWRPEHWLDVDCTRLREDFAWEPLVALPEAVARTVAWERDEIRKDV